MLIASATAPARTPTTPAHRPRAREEWGQRPSEIDRWSAHRAALDAVVLAAGRTPLDDDAAWRTLAGAAQDLTDVLAEAGRIPRYLAVQEAEPNVVVARTLAAVARRVGCDR